VKPSITEDVALLALLDSRPRGTSAADLVRDVLLTGSAAQVWSQAKSDTGMLFASDSDALGEAERAVRGWADAGLLWVSILDPGYPARLRAVQDAPAFLFYRGDLSLLARGMSVVGSRAASEAGLTRAAAAVRVLVDAGYSVISGLASGVDACAHTAAIAAGGRPVGVIATGIAATYTPAGTRALHEQVAETGVLVSQFRPFAGARKQTFLQRNATMSGIGYATFVGDAGERSGARAQARMAMEHGRPVILPVEVVEANQWAQAMRDLPNVHIVGGVDDLSASIEQIEASATDLTGLLTRMVG